MSAVDALVEDCIQRLSRDAPQLFESVRTQEEDGVIWAVFGVQGGENDFYGPPVIKRTSFLALSTVQSSKAQSLITMYDSCNHAAQFVCWFTLEDAHGHPLASKVMVVDGRPRQTNSVEGGRAKSSSISPPQQQEDRYQTHPQQQREHLTHHRNAATADRNGGTDTAEAFMSPNTLSRHQNEELSALKADMFSFQQHQQQQNPSSSVTSTSSPHISRRNQQEHHRYQQQHQNMERESQQISREKEAFLDQMEEEQRLQKHMTMVAAHSPSNGGPGGPGAQHHQQQQQQQYRQQQEDLDARWALSSSAAAAGNTPAGSRLKKHRTATLMSSQQQPQQRTSRSPPRVRTATTSEAQQQKNALQQLHVSFGSSPQSQRRQGVTDCSAGGDDSSSSCCAAQYQQILKVCLQVADSVSKMGNAIDTLQERMDALERHVNHNPPPTKETMTGILSRFDALEMRLDAMDGRIGAFDNIQESFFQQLDAVRKQVLESVDAAYQQHPPRASPQHTLQRTPGGGGALQSRQSNTPSRGVALSEKALISNGRYATAIREGPFLDRTPPPSSGVPGAQLAAPRSSSAVVQGSPGTSVVDTAGESRRGRNEPPTTATENMFSAKTSKRSQSGESLTDMLRSMEMRLGAIKTPQ